LDIVDRLEKEGKLQEFKNEIKNHTLIGEYVGLNFLIKYPRSGIFFHSVINHYSAEHSKTAFEAYSIFKKYNLYFSPMEKVGRRVSNFEDFSLIMTNLSNTIAKNFISSQEEGAVINIITIRYFKL
jgi:hypothetical protein